MASRWETLRAQDVMTSPVRVLEPGLRLDQAIHVLSKVRGVVSTMDLIRAMAHEAAAA